MSSLSDVRRGKVGQPLETVLEINNASPQGTDRFILESTSRCTVDAAGPGGAGWREPDLERLVQKYLGQLAG